MNAKHDFPSLDAARMVYVRPVAVTELPEDLQEMADGLEVLYALHGPDGERLALVRDRGLAFALALHNDLAPVNVH